MKRTEKKASVERRLLSYGLVEPLNLGFVVVDEKINGNFSQHLTLVQPWFDLLAYMSCGSARTGHARLLESNHMEYLVSDFAAR